MYINHKDIHIMYLVQNMFIVFDELQIEIIVCCIHRHDLYHMTPYIISFIMYITITYAHVAMMTLTCLHLIRNCNI